MMRLGPHGDIPADRIRFGGFWKFAVHLQPARITADRDRQRPASYPCMIRINFLAALRHENSLRTPLLCENASPVGILPIQWTLAGYGNADDR